jgi:hypothetical protein
VPGDEPCECSVTHSCTSLEPAAATFLAPRLADAVGIYHDLPRFCGDAEGIAGPIPGALGTVILLLWSA